MHGVRVGQIRSESRGIRRVQTKSIRRFVPVRKRNVAVVKISRIRLNDVVRSCVKTEFTFRDVFDGHYTTSSRQTYRRTVKRNAASESKRSRRRNETRPLKPVSFTKHENRRRRDCDHRSVVYARRIPFCSRPAPRPPPMRVRTPFVVRF